MFDLYQGLQMGFTQQVTLKLSSETSWYSPNCWIIKKARELKKNIYFCFIDYLKAFDCVDHNKLWKILKEMGIPDHLTCLLKNLYAGQEATVRTGHGTTDWFQIGKEVHYIIYKAVYYHPAYLICMQSTLCKMPGCQGPWDPLNDSRGKQSSVTQLQEM